MMPVAATWMKNAAAAGTRIVAACASPECDTACLRGVASSRRDVLTWNKLPRTWLANLSGFGEGVVSVRPWIVTITGTLPVGSLVVPGSASPRPHSVSPDGRSLAWRFTQDLASGVTVTLGLRMTRLGYQAPSLTATAELRDNLHRSKTSAFPDPLLLVLGPKP